MKKLIKRLNNNFKIKLIAFFFAFFMWVYVMAEVDPIVIKNFTSLDVMIVNEELLNSKDMVLSPENEAKMNMILRGRRSILSHIKKEDLKPYIKITEPKLGENIFKINIDKLENIEYNIIDTKLKLEIEQKVEEERVITLVKEGKLPTSYEINRVLKNPSTTWIEGPKSVVEKVDKIQGNYDVSSKTDKFNFKTTLLPLDKEGNIVEGIKLKDSEAILNVYVDKVKHLPIKINMVNELSDDYLFHELTLMEDEKITIKGSKTKIDSINEIESRTIDLSALDMVKIEEDNGELEVFLKIPYGIKANKTTVKAKLNFEKIKSKDLIISKERINIINKAQNLDISKNNFPKEIKVKVRYLQKDEELITQKDTQIIIDMKEYNEGIATLPFIVETNYPYESIEISPSEVKIGDLD
ncbi:MAG: CdaR family protein [Peptostreptococcaceae bacterium]|jgi:YbbR domain-containing protein|nr:CdaR family protein [Peptostreptococcaceae bacterium]